MALILAAETSGPGLSAALIERPDPSGNWILRAETFTGLEMRHSEILKGSCEHLLRQGGWELRDLSALAVGSGPGSFTGLRVGISFLRALAQALEIPLLGIPTFEVLAARASVSRPDFRGIVCVAIESIGEEVYAGLFRAGTLQPLRKFGISSAQELCRDLKSKRGPPVLAIGSGFERHRAMFVKSLGPRLATLPEEFGVPRARDLAFLAAQRMARRPPRPDSWKKVLPLYLREPLAVERMKAGK